MSRRRPLEPGPVRARAGSDPITVRASDRRTVFRVTDEPVKFELERVLHLTQGQIRMMESHVIAESIAESGPGLGPYLAPP